jgi:broad specificity phosphatase PhoE
MSLTIKLIRHGQSAANVGLVNTWEVGDHAIELTAEGHRQAASAGMAIGRDFLSGALVYTSPFRRARQTLDGVLSGAALDRSEVLVYEDPRLREVEHGYAGVPAQRQLQATHGTFYYRFNGGESPADCYDRTSGFLEGMMRQLRRKEAERVLIVTHGLTIRCFVMRYLHLTVEQFDSIGNPANCDVVTIGPLTDIREPAFATSRWAVSGLRSSEARGGGVSRESAHTIGVRAIAERRLGKGVRAVCAFEEVTRAPALYGLDLSRCWIVYADAVEPPGGLRSSTVVLVDRGSGEVLYAGAANDEG